MKAPRVTTKVLNGLVIIRRALVGNAPLRDRVRLDMEKPEVRRALQWIAQADAHRQRYAVAKRWLDG